jgi:type II secretory ATPase GspE/PulE/Tfp pilus assembly ATPase PilB-like protein
MINPTDIETVKFLEKKFGQPIAAFYITKNDFERALLLYKGTISDEYQKILKVINNEESLAEDKESAIVKIVDLIISYGHLNGASDIHIEPGHKTTKVRFRIDGIMHKILELPKDIHESIISRIKILSKMRIDEHLAAQDGKIKYVIEGKQLDIRVSILPVSNGENAVLRLLSANARQMTLESLGIDSKDLKKIRQAMKGTVGMILITGPTGSGKTTTIYEILKILNTEDVHISTIEDPIEYDIEGVSQIQVNVKTNLTFASGLRAIVRQDPDIIMVGEIRDEETAKIAVNSAMTGHLVLSTLHANDSATTLPRLLDMGIEPFLAASTVKIVIAQRLVRVICEKCRASYTLSGEEIKAISDNPPLLAAFHAHRKDDLAKVFLYKGAGCKVCANTGYVGRIGIYEILELNKDIKSLILGRASSDEIMQAAKAGGMRIMLEDGISKVFNGLTTLEEVLRVIQE